MHVAKHHTLFLSICQVFQRSIGENLSAYAASALVLSTSSSECRGCAVGSEGSTVWNAHNSNSCSWPRPGSDGVNTLNANWQ